MEDKEHPVIGFGLDYANQLVFCEAIMQDRFYDIHFDGKWMASVIYNDDMEWSQASGMILPGSIIGEIGYRIDSNYK